MNFEIAIEIKSLEIHERRGISRSGKPFHIREQFGYIDLGKPYPLETRISLDQAAAAYPPGPYFLDPGSIYVNRFGQLAIGRMKLISATPSKSR